MYVHVCKNVVKRVLSTHTERLIIIKSQTTYKDQTIKCFAMRHIQWLYFNILKAKTNHLKH